jgi:hypothetical protein
MLVMERDAAHRNPCETTDRYQGMMEFLEDPNSFLSHSTSERTTYRSHLYRTTITPEVEDNDPRNGYASVEDEMIASRSACIPAYSGQRCLAKLEGHGGGIQRCYTWARDSFFRNRDGRAVMQDCFTSVGRKTETVEITAEATMNTNLYKARRNCVLRSFCTIHRTLHNESLPFVVSLNHRQLKWMNFESSKILKGKLRPQRWLPPLPQSKSRQRFV